MPSLVQQPPPEYKLRNLRVDLQMDFSPLAASATTMTAFKAGMRRDIANAASLPVEQVRIPAIVSGSVVASVTLQFPASMTNLQVRPRA